MGSDASTVHHFPSHLVSSSGSKLRVVVCSPRCMDGGTRDAPFPKNVDMHFLARDVALLIEKLWGGKAVYVAGWAYGASASGGGFGWLS